MLFTCIFPRVPSSCDVSLQQDSAVNDCSGTVTSVLAASDFATFEVNHNTAKMFAVNAGIGLDIQKPGPLAGGLQELYAGRGIYIHIGAV